MNTRLLIALLLAALPAVAQTPAPATAPVATVSVPTNAAAGCRARLLVDGNEKEVFLVRRQGDQLYFRLPNMPANALSAIRFDSVQAAEFAGEVDFFAVFEATRTRRWREAANAILSQVAPALPFLDLPKNNMTDLALEAGLYMSRAADAARGPDGAVTPASKLYYEQAVRIFSLIAAADWYNGKDSARLRASLCQVASGNLDDAEKWFNASRIPDRGDGDYGLHALVQAAIHLARGRKLEACAASARSVAFENKDPDVFPYALLLEGRCHEELLDYYRARDIYYELARLFGSTEPGEQGLERLRFIMDNKLTEEKEKANIAKVFFGSEEDMDKLAREFLNSRKPPEKK